MSNTVQLFKALADETRLRILNLIGQREVCVCQIAETLGLGQSKVSRHLAHLRNAGLVSDRRQGPWMYYSLAPPRGRLHQQVVAWLRQAKDEIPLGGADLKALRDLGKCGELCPDHQPSEEDEQCEDLAAVGS